MTEKVRLSIPMKASTRDAIKHLANTTGSSIGSTAGSFLDEMAGTFLKISDAYELIRTDPQAGIAALQKAGLEAQQSMTEEQLNLLGMGGIGSPLD